MVSISPYDKDYRPVVRRADGDGASAAAINACYAALTPFFPEPLPSLGVVAVDVELPVEDADAELPVEDADVELPPDEPAEPADGFALE